MERSLSIVVPALAACLLLLVFPCSLEAYGEDCFSSWTRPVVCGVQVGFSVDDGDWKTVAPGKEIRLSMGSKVELEIKAVDQSGWTFPEERLMVGIEEEYGFHDYFTIDEKRGNRLVLIAKNRQGEARVRFWIPGNLNLEWEVGFEIEPIRSFTRSQSEYIVRGLYRAILDRDPDRGGFEPAVMEVQRGRIKSQVDSMFYSDEFKRKRRSLTANELLIQFYEGLLNRKPDSEAVRTYLRRLEKKKYSETIMRIIATEEYQRKLVHR